MTDTNLVTRAAFARLHSVSKTAVQKWEGKGLLAIVDGKVAVERSDRALLHAGAGRFSDRARRPSDNTADGRGSVKTADEWDGEVKNLPFEARILVAFVNRIAAHGGLSAWEVGAPVEIAQKTDTLFRVLVMDAAAELLTDMGTVPPGETWADVPMWSDERLAQIDWSAIAAEAQEAGHVEP